MKPLELDDVYDEVAEAVMNALIQFSEQRCRHLNRDAVGVEMGKAMIVLGGTFVSAAIYHAASMPKDAPAALAPAYRCVKEYREMAARMRPKQ